MSAVITGDSGFNTSELSTVISELIKTNTQKPIVELSGSDLVTSQKFGVLINDTYHKFSAGLTVTLPVLVNATDYKVYAKTDGTLVAQPWDDSAPSNSTFIAWFHVYHTTGGINPYSIFDLRYRPAAGTGRAMTRSPNGTCVDIYLMHVDYGIDFYSRPDQTIADGSSPPKIPSIYGGDGTATYGSLTWFEAWDLAIAAGKRLPFYGEFTGFAFGVVEQQAVGVDPITTKYQAGHRSACGVEQATGVTWQWGADIQGNVGGGWQAITDGRGSVYNSGISAVLLGADWSGGSIAGSRSSSWSDSPSNSDSVIGVRGVCDHLIL